MRKHLYSLSYQDSDHNVWNFHLVRTQPHHLRFRTMYSHLWGQQAAVGYGTTWTTSPQRGEALPC